MPRLITYLPTAGHSSKYKPCPAMINFVDETNDIIIFIKPGDIDINCCPVV